MGRLETYAQWVKALDHFANGEDSILEQLNAGVFELDGGTAQRFFLKVEETYRKRKQEWLNKFQRMFQFHTIKKETEIEIIIRNANQNLLPLIKFVGLKSLPENLKKTLQKDLDHFVGEIKRDLKKNIPKTHPQRERILVILNAFGIPNYTQKTDLFNAIDRKNKLDPFSSTSRKIIF